MTKRCILQLLAVLLFLSSPVRAQVPSASQRKQIAAELDVNAQELVTLEKETAHALSQNSSSFFSRVYSDDYVGVAANGEILDKGALISSIQHSPIRYSTFVVTNISVRVYGASAVVTATWTTRGVQDGRTFARQYRVLHVYVNANGEGNWKAIAGQETMLPG